MRDEFSKPTKDKLAQRVAYQCSFPGCGRVTIGPGNKDSSDISNLGEAAHITAASEKGPRYDSKMTSTQRKSIDNGIWMCRHHARIIDVDYTNYSVSTLKQWKDTAEKNAALALQEFEKKKIEKATTLVSIGRNIVFEGIWKSVDGNIWVFEIIKFLLGDENKLRAYNSNEIPKNHNYIVVETQGDGRVIKGNLKWELKESLYEITINVEDKIPATTPYELSDISDDFEIENGDFKLVKGEECAKQIIANTLSTHFGDLWFYSDFGSFFSIYYWKFKNDKETLKKLLKLEITRLISIPEQDKALGTETPALNFIKRVIDVDVIDSKSKDGDIVIRLELEWGDGKRWEDEITIYIRPEEEIINQ